MTSASIFSRWLAIFLGAALTLAIQNETCPGESDVNVALQTKAGQRALLLHQDSVRKIKGWVPTWDDIGKLFTGDCDYCFCPRFDGWEILTSLDLCDGYDIITDSKCGTKTYDCLVSVPTTKCEKVMGVTVACYPDVENIWDTCTEVLSCCEVEIWSWIAESWDSCVDKALGQIGDAKDMWNKYIKPLEGCTSLDGCQKAVQEGVDNVKKDFVDLVVDTATPILEAAIDKAIVPGTDVSFKDVYEIMNDLTRMSEGIMESIGGLSASPLLNTSSPCSSPSSSFLAYATSLGGAFVRKLADYVEYPEGSGYISAETPSATTMNFSIECSSEAEVTFQVEAISPDGNSDSLSLMTAEGWAVWGTGKFASWQWSIPSPVFQASSGVNQVSIKAREDGIKIKQFRMSEGGGVCRFCHTCNPTYAPVSAAAAEIYGNFVRKEDYVELPDNTGNETDSSMAFRVLCSSTAEVTFQAEVLTPDGGANSFNVATSSGLVAWDAGLASGWHWSMSSPTFRLSSGRSSLSIVGREDGIKVRSFRIITGGDQCRFCEVCTPQDGPVVATAASISGVFVAEPDYVELPQGTEGESGWDSSTLSLGLLCTETADMTFQAEVISPDPNADSFWFWNEYDGWITWEMGQRSNWGWSPTSPFVQASSAASRVLIKAREDGIKVKRFKIEDGNGVCRFCVSCSRVDGSIDTSSVSMAGSGLFVRHSDYIELPEGTYQTAGWDSSTLSFKLACTESADVTFQAEVISPDGNADSFLLSTLDGWAAWGTGKFSSWSWSFSSPVFPASSGENQVLIRAREDGIKVKRFQIIDGAGKCHFCSTPAPAVSLLEVQEQKEVLERRMGGGSKQREESSDDFHVSLSTEDDGRLCFPNLIDMVLGIWPTDCGIFQTLRDVGKPMDWIGRSISDLTGLILHGKDTTFQTLYKKIDECASFSNHVRLPGVHDFGKIPTPFFKKTEDETCISSALTRAIEWVINRIIDGAETVYKVMFDTIAQKILTEVMPLLESTKVMLTQTQKDDIYHAKYNYGDCLTEDDWAVRLQINGEMEISHSVWRNMGAGYPPESSFAFGLGGGMVLGCKDKKFKPYPFIFLSHPGGPYFEFSTKAADPKSTWELSWVLVGGAVFSGPLNKEGYQTLEEHQVLAEMEASIQMFATFPPNYCPAKSAMWHPPECGAKFLVPVYNMVEKEWKSGFEDYRPHLEFFAKSTYKTATWSSFGDMATALGNSDFFPEEAELEKSLLWEDLPVPDYIQLVDLRQTDDQLENAEQLPPTSEGSASAQSLLVQKREKGQSAGRSTKTMQESREKGKSATKRRAENAQRKPDEVKEEDFAKFLVHYALKQLATADVSSLEISKVVSNHSSGRSGHEPYAGFGVGWEGAYLICPGPKEWCNGEGMDLELFFGLTSAAGHVLWR
eukprot:TRINITY_DN76988_c0_g1_i1.p1 TRINITY_DN76988_c0_g1~~TRINITY_DN76988_c0_g1_i1.p1  ORF type:complete len:1411 (+),score=201.49 TRINITY_DN76988_c0_g1_i1:159-4391(+)